MTGGLDTGYDRSPMYDQHSGFTGYSQGSYYPHHHIRGMTMKERMQMRKMTDVACGCGFFIFWCFMGMVASIGLNNGDPRRLYHGFDYEGRLCGVNASVANKTLLYWPDQSRMDLPVCVDRCPGNRIHSISVPRESVVVTHGTDFVRTEIMRQDAILMTYPSREVSGRFCVPAAPGSNISRSIMEQMEFSPMAMFTDSVRDICNAWSVLIFMLPLSMAVGYGYIILLRYCARTVLNIVLASLILGTAAVSFFCLYFVGHNPSLADTLLGEYTDHPVRVVWMVGVLSAVLCFFLLCAGYSFWMRVEKISAVVEVAGDAMWSVQLLLAMPVLEVILKGMYTVIWMVFASYVLSNGDMTGSHLDVEGHRLQGLVRTFGYSLEQKIMIMFYCIGYFWGLEFFSMLFRFVMSYAVSIWYFQPCRADMSKPEVSPEVWRNAFTYALYYHLGSLTIGAAVTVLLYVFMPVNILLEWWLSVTYQYTNPVVKAIVYSCTCCVKCVSEIVSYVNKGAIVEMVLRGDHDFFAAAGSAMRVMRTAEDSIVSLHGVTIVFQIVGLVTTTAVGGFGTWWFTGTVNIFADQHSEYYLENRLGITIIAGLIAMSVSMVFMWTLDQAADTLVFCWLVEGEDDRTHQTFAPKLLRNVVRFDDWNPSKDGRMVRGLSHGNYPYEGMIPGSGLSTLDYNSPSKMSMGGVGGYGLGGVGGMSGIGTGGGAGWSSTSHLTNTASASNSPTHGGLNR